MSRKVCSQRVLLAGIGNLIFISGIFTDSPPISYGGEGGGGGASLVVRRFGDKKQNEVI